MHLSLKMYFHGSLERNLILLNGHVKTTEPKLMMLRIKNLSRSPNLSLRLNLDEVKGQGPQSPMDLTSCHIWLKVIPVPSKRQLVLLMVLYGKKQSKVRLTPSCKITLGN